MMLQNIISTSKNPMWVSPFGIGNLRPVKHRQHLRENQKQQKQKRCRPGGLQVSASIFGRVPGLGSIVDTIDDIVHHRQKIKGTVVLTKKHILDFTSIGSSLFDGVLDLVGQKVSLQLVSEDYSDPKDEKLGGKIGKPAYLKTWNATLTPITVSDTTYEVNFDLDEDLGIPGAFIIKNNHENEFFLKTVTLENVPGHGTVQFVCNSWVYPARYYKKDRIFFSNKTYLPDQTPEPLKKYREQELNVKRGDGKSEMQEWDRVYDYAYYNDLGDSDRGDEYTRPVLGGAEHPYPRRGRTGRPPLESDPKTESRLPLLSLDIYVPRDEKFGHEKMSDFIGYGLKAVPQFILPELKALLGSSGDSGHFESFEETLGLYEGGIKLPGVSLASGIMKTMNLEMLSQILPTDGQGLLRFPMPQVIKEDRDAWMTDEEFGRQTLAGVNPVTIRRLEEFPPKSKLDRKQYGDQDSKITEDHIKNNLDGLTVAQAINNNKLYMLDYHDALLPYVKRINSTPSTKIYATRTLLFLNDDGTLKPVAIELSLPHPERDELGAISTVYTPAEEGAEGAIWKLAKAYAAVNDSGYHQLVSHWLNTHAVMEPFVIATNRQLSDVHPIYKLLQPHFRDTMTINALARQTLINAGGILELTVFPNKYALELSSAVYKNWVFTDQALPRDLKKRGMAVEDPNSPHGLRLLIEDYPFAVDGLEVWSATRDWVKDYCSFYYKNDEMVRKDPELQSWWKDVREKGHGDLKDATWWPKMDTLENLIESCTTILWIGSALHAAVNFGQYPYAGYLPNRPTLSCRFMPEKGTPEYAELEEDPEKAFLKTVTPRLQTLLGISLIEILSKHASDELYLGQRNNPDWTADSGPLEALKKFEDKMEEIEIKILKMNSEDKYKNRFGPVQMPYTLLVPTSEEGLTGKGVPNSISI